MKNKLIAAYLAIFALAVVIVLFDLAFPLRYYGYVKKYCDSYGVEQSTALAVIWAESRFDEGAISSQGAQGLMQVMPSTAKWLCQSLGIEYRAGMLLEPEANVRLGVYYLSYLQNRFEGDSVIAAYNAGEGNVRAWLNDGGEVRFAETRRYIKKVNLAKKVYSLRIKNT